MIIIIILYIINSSSTAECLHACGRMTYRVIVFIRSMDHAFTSEILSFFWGAAIDSTRIGPVLP